MKTKKTKTDKVLSEITQNKYLKTIIIDIISPGQPLQFLLLLLTTSALRRGSYKELYLYAYS